MIKKENIKELLELMHFTLLDLEKNLYFKTYDHGDSISVDIDSEEIIWPKELKVNDKTTSNFDHPENFVVLECVNRLLSKGYFAKNMELEPRWQVGRGASGGKADILVKDNNGHEYLLIECKTYGIEYEKGWQKTLTDGDQLFSYAQQIKKTQYLCLYTSNIEGNELFYNNKVIIIKDNEEYLKTLKPSKRKRFKEASDVKELYNVWKDIYNLEAEETGIFEDSIAPYEINKLYTIDDLKTIKYEDTQKKYNEFATILRQHNVSGHENAFDKLVNIFLAKIVDEIQHPNSLKFNWKGVAYDDYYQLQDRLQKLYKDGMQKFLNEEVTYIDNKQINDAFKLFKNDSDATKDTVMSYFRELKFYTNNDFSFIDVHNEDLFKQNSEVLLKIIRMFQDIKLKTDEQNQFLGDLFEGFLDDGIKQSEGQYLTPLPITRFIISSLPLEKIVEENDEPPRVIDYACGAGHFLNEYANQIKHFVGDRPLKDFYSSIYGIEKEYRLSKVSKVSAFMYGQDDINITYGDALAINKNIKDNSYNILVANPPYSVKGFLETLNDEERGKYELSQLIKPNSYATNNAIETFFVERAKQLLKEDGVAGIILPSSILNNGSNVYTKAREILLCNFDIISIVELPGKTFGAAGTTTIIIFLKKKKSEPSLATHYKNRVNDWFSGKFERDDVFNDEELFISYLEKQGYDYDEYVDFIKGNLGENLKKNKIFKQYLNNKNIKNYSDMIKIEKDKLYYYILSLSQKNNVLYVTAPTDSSSVKQYLGYEWSGSHGNKSIKYVGANLKEDDTILKNKSIKNIKTPLFNGENLYDDEKINSLIRANYNCIELENEYDFVDYIALTDLIDFSSSTFDKSISITNNVNHLEIKSKYELRSLYEVAKVIRGTVIKEEDTKQGNIKVIAGGIDYAYKHNQSNRLENTITVSGSGANAGYINFWKEKIWASDCTTINCYDDKYQLYVYYFLKGIQNKVFTLRKGQAQKHVYPKDLELIDIPIPPDPIVEEIVSKCLKVDKKFVDTRMTTEEYVSNLEKVFIEKEVILIEKNV